MKADTFIPSSRDRPTPTEDAIPHKLPVECRHAEWETLGSGGNATYLQCRACGVMIVSQGGRLWSLSLKRPQGI